MPSDWMKWCRFCAKIETNVSITTLESLNNLCSILEKHSIITSSQENLTPQCICRECYEFIEKLNKFCEHCAKVEELFSQLRVCNEDKNDLQTIRYQHGLDLDEDILVKRDKTLNEDKSTDTDDLIIITRSLPMTKRQRNRPIRLKKSRNIVKTEEDSQIDVQPINCAVDDCENYGSIKTESGNENVQSDNDDTDAEKATNTNYNKKHDDKKMFNCSLCKLEFIRKPLYEAHNRAHHASEHICSLCAKKFTTLKGLKRHRTTHLSDSERLKYPCEYCDKRFSQLNNVKIHVRSVHTRDRPFICEECGKCFVGNGALKEHQIIHSDESPFQCSHCPKKFKNMARMRMHEDIHKHTTYICPHCGLQLNTKRTLRRHMVVHSDQKKFKCQYCGNEYKRSRSLKDHLILHTGLRPYTCPFCRHTFANASNFRKHKKTSHPVEFAAQEASGERQPPVIKPKLKDLQPRILLNIVDQYTENTTETK